MSTTIRGALHFAGLLVAAMSIAPTEVQASIVRFDGTLSVRGTVDGSVNCAVGSPCAQVFEIDTGITPIISEFAQGRLSFAYDTTSHSVLAGSTFVLSSFSDPDIATYDVSVGGVSAGGTFLTSCYGGVSLHFAGTNTGSNGSVINGRVTYCLPAAVPGQVVSLDDFVASGLNTFGGGTYIQPISGTGWGLSSTGNTLRMIPEPSSLALGALGLLVIGLRRRVTSL